MLVSVQHVHVYSLGRAYPQQIYLLVCISKPEARRPKFIRLFTAPAKSQREPFGSRVQSTELLP